MRVVRRDLLKGSLGLMTAAVLARPALAAGKTITVWWNQGYYPEEDAALRSVVSAWEKATGNNIELTLLPAQALNQKIVSALTTATCLT